MPAELSGIDAVLGEQVIKCRSGNAEKFSCARQVPLGHRERLSDGLHLGPLARDAQIEVFRIIARILSPRSFAVTTAPSAMITAPLMRFSSSRTLPGQRCA